MSDETFRAKLARDLRQDRYLIPADALNRETEAICAEDAGIEYSQTPPETIWVWGLVGSPNLYAERANEHSGCVKYVRADRIEQLERELGEARQYGTHLAGTMAAKHYPEVTTWKALPDVVGVLTQIDNMVAGMADQLAAEKALADRLADEIKQSGVAVSQGLIAHRKARGL